MAATPPHPLPREDVEEEPIAKRTRSRTLPPPLSPTTAETAPAPRVVPIAHRTRSRKQTLKATLVRLFGLLAATATASCVGAAVLPLQRRVPPPSRLIVALPPTPPSPAVRPALAASRQFPSTFPLHLAYPVVNEKTGESLEYRQLKHHPELS